MKKQISKSIFPFSNLIKALKKEKQKVFALSFSLKKSLERHSLYQAKPKKLTMFEKTKTVKSITQKSKNLKT